MGQQMRASATNHRLVLSIIGLLIAGCGGTAVGPIVGATATPSVVQPNVQSGTCTVQTVNLPKPIACTAQLAQPASTCVATVETSDQRGAGGYTTACAVSQTTLTITLSSPSSGDFYPVTVGYMATRRNGDARGRSASSAYVTASTQQLTHVAIANQGILA